MPDFSKLGVHIYRFCANSANICAVALRSNTRSSALGLSNILNILECFLKNVTEKLNSFILEISAFSCQDISLYLQPNPWELR